MNPIPAPLLREARQASRDLPSNDHDAARLLAAIRRTKTT